MRTMTILRAGALDGRVLEPVADWLSVFRVGVAGGMALRKRDGAVVARSADKHAAHPITA